MAVVRTAQVETYAHDITITQREGRIRMRVVTLSDGVTVKDKDVVMTQQEFGEFVVAHAAVFQQMSDAFDLWLIENGHAEGVIATPEAQP